MPPRNPSCAAARAAILSCVLLALAPGGVRGVVAADVRAEELRSSEPRIKAAWVAKFLHYIEWPGGAAARAGEKITIGFLGDDPIYGELSGLVSGKAPLVVRGRKVALKHLASTANLKGCQVLFISRSSKADAKGVLSAVQGAGVLTISDIDRFVAMGGMIGFRSEGERIRLEIDGAAARKEGLRIDPDLLIVFNR